MVSIKRKILYKGEIIQEQLLRVLQRHEDYINSDTKSEAAIAEVVGDENSGLVKDVNDLKTGKANANHTHTLNKVTDLTTVEAVVTYADESTETILLVKQVTE